MTEPPPPVVTINDPLRPGVLVEVLAGQEPSPTLPPPFQTLALVVALVLLAGLGAAVAQRATVQDRRDALGRIVLPETSSQVHVRSQGAQLFLEYTHFFLNDGSMAVQLRQADLGDDWQLFSVVPLALFPQRPTAVLFRRSLSCQSPYVRAPERVTARLAVPGAGEGQFSVALTRRDEGIQDEIRRSCGLGSPREAVALAGYGTQGARDRTTLHLALANDGIQDVTVTRVLVEGFSVLRGGGPVALPGRPLGPTPDDLARVPVTVLLRLDVCPLIDRRVPEPALRLSGVVRLRLRGADGVEQELVAMLGELATAARFAAATRCEFRAP